MFAEPTVGDFVARIDWHINKALDRAGRAVGMVRGTAAKNGMFGSGNRVISSIDAARAELEVGIDATLGELNRTIRHTNLDGELLRNQAGERLVKFAADIKDAAQLGDMPNSLGVRKYVDEQFAAFDKHLEFALRQFDVGFHDAPEPELPPMTDNSITVGNMTGNIQQNSPGATQTFESKMNIAAAQAALQTFESELSKIEVDDRARQDLAADIATIKAQLSKPSPSASILREAAKTVRSVSEGIVAGVLTSPLMQAAIALGTALGLN